MSPDTAERLGVLRRTDSALRATRRARHCCAVRDGGGRVRGRSDLRQATAVEHPAAPGDGEAPEFVTLLSHRRYRLRRLRPPYSDRTRCATHRATVDWG